MRLVAAAALVALALGPAASAQPAAQAAPVDAAAPPASVPLTPDADLGSAVVEALEVLAPPPGPALWKVTKGDAEVTVLGAINPLPQSLAWDTGRVGKALDGATVLIDLSPQWKMGAVDMLRFSLSQGKMHQPDGKTLEQTLPPALRDRFIGARTAARQGASRYASWKPVVAGINLLNDYRQAAGLSNAKPGSTLKKLATARGVPDRTPVQARAAPLASGAAGLSDQASLDCLADAIDQVQQESDHAQIAAKAWAMGDLKTVRANYAEPPLEKCLEQVPNGAALIERGTQDSTKALLDALRGSTKSVAVVDLNFLLRPNGVLDRLKAQGATITVPIG